MNPDTVVQVGREALVVVLKLTGPPLLVSLAVGLVIAMFQAATQINEMTLTFVPKLLAIGVVLLLGGSWMLGVMVDYMQGLVRSIPALIG